MVPLHLIGMPFDEQNKNEWVRADTIIETMDYFRQVGEGLYGADLYVLMNMNVFLKPDKILVEDGYRQMKIVDELIHLFRIPISIPVHDHHSDPSELIGYLRTYEVEDMDLGYLEQAGVFQYNVSSTMFFLSKWEGQA
jgi:hypothetical protein